MQSRTTQSVPSKVFKSIETRHPLSGDGAKAVSALKLLLQKKKHIIVMSGAGISVNAGSKSSSLPHFLQVLTMSVPDFQSLRKSEKSSFDISVYNSAADTAGFHTMICNLSRLSSQAKPTAFHYFLDGLASNGRLIRHYTQNIDCIEHQLPNLGERTVQLHGRIDEAVCQSCGWRTSFLPSRFCGSDLPDCTRCQGVALDREREGKRQRGIGRLRPNIVLYGEDNPNGRIIGASAKQDIRAGPDAVFMVGTALKVPGAKKLARELCRAVQDRGGVTVWINKDVPASGLKLPLDLVLQGDCDEVASLLLS